MLLVHGGVLSCAVGFTGGGVDEALHATAAGRLQEVQGAGAIHRQELLRGDVGIRDGDERGQVAADEATGAGYQAAHTEVDVEM